MEFSKKSNVYCLEGNHEIHLWRWANQESTKSDMFNDVTAKELESAGVDKKEVRRFYRSLWQCGLFAFNDNKLICTHGGVTNVPTLLTPTCELIKGVGGYEDSKMFILFMATEIFLKNRSGLMIAFSIWKAKLNLAAICALLR